jgi:hypothetical protein
MEVLMLKQIGMVLTLALFALPAGADELPEQKPVYAAQASQLSTFAAAEKAALQSPLFQEAREKLKSSMQRPSFMSRTVIPWGGMKTFHPGSTYLVIERWYGFDSYRNLVAEVDMKASIFPSYPPRVTLLKIGH